MNGKPVLISGKDTKCTVTNSKEFAIAAVGLFMNSKAYGEAFHITAGSETTWGNIAETIGKKLNRKVNLVDIPIEFLQGKKNIGIDIAELSGDKSRDMVFDNSKIRDAVPEFKGEISFDNGIDATIQYYKENKNARKINYLWDARADRTLIDYYKKNNIPYERNTLVQKSNEQYGMKDKIMYKIGKSDFIYILAVKIRELTKKRK